MASKKPTPKPAAKGKTPAKAKTSKASKPAVEQPAVPVQTPAEPTVETIAVASVKVDPLIQQRAGGIDTEWAEELAEVLRSGKPYKDKPILYRDPAGVLWLAGGFHRQEGAIRSKVESIPYEVRSGTRRDALEFALGDNSDHGLRRTNEDKRKAVETALADAEWGKLSARAIADLCSVDPAYAARVRRELTGEAPDPVKSAAAKASSDSQGHTGTAEGGEKGAAKPHPEEKPQPTQPATKTVEAGPSIACPACNGEDSKCPTCSGEGRIPEAKLASLPKVLQEEAELRAKRAEAEGEMAVEADSLARSVGSLCRDLDKITAEAERFSKHPAGYATHWPSLIQQLKSARSSLWAGRLSQVCPTCQGKEACKPTVGCRGHRRLKAAAAEQAQFAKDRKEGK